LCFDGSCDRVFYQVDSTGFGVLQDTTSHGMNRCARAVQNRIPDKLALDHVVPSAYEKIAELAFKL